MSNELRKALSDLLDLLLEYEGIAGYHCNGNISYWEEHPEIEAAKQALEQDDWQPIETAPTDTGEYFLLKIEPIDPFEGEPDYYCTVGCWWDEWVERCIGLHGGHYPIPDVYKVIAFKRLTPQPPKQKD